ncbi:MAG: DUF167 domain-containing protein [Patescibacteria group bacterium]
MEYPRIEELTKELGAKGSVSFSVSVHPGARTTGIQSIFENGVIKINITKPADQGKANKELIRFLAEIFGVSQVYVDIITGETSRLKGIRITRQ